MGCICVEFLLYIFFSFSLISRSCVSNNIFPSNYASYVRPLKLMMRLIFAFEYSFGFPLNFQANPATFCLRLPEISIHTWTDFVLGIVVSSGERCQFNSALFLVPQTTCVTRVDLLCRLCHGSTVMRTPSICSQPTTRFLWPAVQLGRRVDFW